MLYRQRPIPRGDGRRTWSGLGAKPLVESGIVGAGAEAAFEQGREEIGPDHQDEEPQGQAPEKTRPLGPPSRGAVLRLDEKQHGDIEDRGGKGDKGPGIEMDPEQGRAIAPSPGAI